MEYQRVFQRVTEEYSSKILNWAIKKTGNRPDDEDLAQEVLAQVFVAILREKEISEVENFVWKVAHYVWCNNLRKLMKEKNNTTVNENLPDGLDFVEEILNKESLIYELNRMRREIADLSFIQREAMIFHYIDGLPLATVAKKLNTSVSTIKWHLFDARKKIREELDVMKNETSYVYRPGRLSLGLSGMPGPNPATNKVNDSLIRQNLCLLCYRDSKSIDELAALTGIPKPYLEYDLNWLVNHEFLSLKGKKYTTTIPIINKRHRQEIGELYRKTREEYVDKVIDHLSNDIDNIKKIGFYGSSFAADKLMWSLMMMFLSYFSRNSERATKLKKIDDRAIRPDGGRYYVVGNDLSDGQDLNPDGYFNPAGWGNFYGILSDSCVPDEECETYYWLGLYNYSSPENQPALITKSKADQKEWHRLLCSLIEPSFDVNNLSPDQKEKLAVAIQTGLVAKEGDKYGPTFVIMTKQELLQLQDKLFKPLLEEITPKTEELAKTISQMHYKNFPPVSRGYIDYFTYLDLWYFGIYAFTFAAQDKKLYIPQTPQEGVPLTLVLVK